MQSLQLVSEREFEVRTMEDPPGPGPGEVLVRIRAVGICGSDLHFYEDGGIAGQPATYPIVLGHEPGGEVAEVGPGVETFKLGDKVAVEPNIIPKECEFTRSGHRNWSDNIVFLGGLQIPGALREYVVVPEENCIAIPGRLTFADAALVEPVAILLHSLELAELKFGEAVAVVGAGPIGLLAVALAKQAGAAPIVAADIVPHRLRRARELGANLAVDVRTESVQDAVMDLTGRGAHVVFDAAGKPESINTAIECLRPGGRLVVIGIPSEEKVGIKFWNAMAKEARIVVQKRSNGNDHAALDLIERGLIRKESIMSHFYPLSEGGKAFAAACQREDGIIKPVIEL